MTGKQIKIGEVERYHLEIHQNTITISTYQSFFQKLLLMPPASQILVSARQASSAFNGTHSSAPEAVNWTDVWSKWRIPEIEFIAIPVNDGADYLIDRIKAQIAYPYIPLEIAPIDGTEINALVGTEPKRIRFDSGHWFIVTRGGQCASRLCQIPAEAIYGWIPFPPTEPETETQEADHG